LTVLTVPGIDDLNVGAGVASHEVLAAELVDHHYVGHGEVFHCAHGQQTGITWTGADEGDPAGLTSGLLGPR
jgi:hypothetical protein